MKSVLFVVLFLFFASINIFSQDIITLNNNFTIDAKNIVLTPKEVKYQNYYDKEGKEIILEKNKVASILYENGSKIKIYEAKVPISQSTMGVNLITYHFLDLIVGNFTISYERIIAKGKFGIAIPISFGYSTEPVPIYFPPPFDDEYSNMLVNEYFSGITFNIYPTGQGKVRYFLGPSLRFGSGKYFTSNNYGYDSNNAIATGYFKFLVNNGVMFTFADALTISVVGSIGIQHLYNINHDKTQTTGAIAANMSFRF